MPTCTCYRYMYYLLLLYVTNLEKAYMPEVGNYYCTSFHTLVLILIKGLCLMNELTDNYA